MARAPNIIAEHYHDFATLWVKLTAARRRVRWCCPRSDPIGRSAPPVFLVCERSRLPLPGSQPASPRRRCAIACRTSDSDPRSQCAEVSSSNAESSSGPIVVIRSHHSRTSSGGAGPTRPAVVVRRGPPSPAGTSRPARASRPAYRRAPRWPASAPGTCHRDPRYNSRAVAAEPPELLARLDLAYGLEEQGQRARRMGHRFGRVSAIAALQAPERPTIYRLPVDGLRQARTGADTLSAGPPWRPRATAPGATVPPRRRRTTRRTWPLRTARGSPAAPVVEVSLRPILGGPSVRRRDGGDPDGKHRAAAALPSVRHGNRHLGHALRLAARQRDFPIDDVRRRVHQIPGPPAALPKGEAR